MNYLCLYSVLEIIDNKHLGLETLDIHNTFLLTDLHLGC